MNKIFRIMLSILYLLVLLSISLGWFAVMFWVFHVSSIVCFLSSLVLLVVSNLFFIYTYPETAKYLFDWEHDKTQ